MVFSNKFNSKKVDPLVEAAKAAMELGQKRRDAIAAVNEEFGVYGRNAVVRENLAAYDARIEEVYRGMQSGNLTEGKKLADKDYDKDGKIESPKDEVWGSRFRAAKKAGKMEEKKDCYEGAMDSDVVGGGAVTKDNKPVVSQTASKADTSGPSAADKAGLAAKIGAMKEAKLNEAVSRKHFQQVADLIKGHESQEKRNELASHHASIFSKQNPRFDHGRFHKAAGSTAHEEPKKMEEAAYSFKAARSGKDIGKPGKNFAKIASKAAKRYGSEEKGKKVAGAILAKIRAKHMEEQVSLNTPLPPKRPANLGTPKPAAPLPPRRPASLGGASKPGVVSKSDLDTYRKNVGNQNATLGQYMNDLKGKTAATGGKNDPTQIQKTLNKGQKAFDPTERPVSVKGSAYYNKALDRSEPNPQGPPQPPEPKNDPLDSTNTPVAGSRHDGGAGLDAPTPTPPKQGSGESYKDREPGWRDTPPQPAPVKPLAGEPPPPARKADDQEAKNKSSSMVAESVMVGGNRYRIV